MVGQHRSGRVAEQMKKEIAAILREEIKDPRIGFVTVTGVEVAGDHRHAKVFVSILGSEEEKAHSMEGLNKATGFVRSEIAKRIRLRYTPEIIFKYDESIERGIHISSLLHQVIKEETDEQHDS